MGRSVAAGDRPVQAQPRHLARVLTIWIVLSIICMVLVGILLPKILPVAASSVEKFANDTILVFTIIAIPVAMFVWVFLGYSLVVFRVKGKQLDDGPALQPTPIAQAGWLGITGALCLFLLVWGLVGVYVQTEASPANTLEVGVTGQQWTWSYNYPQYGISSHTLMLPIHRAVVFKVRSQDVLHGFAIQELGVRIDANPDQVISTSPITPNRLGGYYTRCVELCGLYHSYMFNPVKVVTPAQFKSWINSQGGHA